MTDFKLIMNVIYDAIDEINEQLSQENQVHKSMDAVLLGDGSALDSLGMINLIVAIEQRIEQGLGRSISLLDEDQLTSQDTPFYNVKALTHHIADLLESEDE